MYLDKSARPPYWFIKELHQQVCPDEVFPDTVFMNVGLEKGDEISTLIVDEAEETYSASSLMTADRIVVMDEYGSEGVSLDNAVAIVESINPNAEVIDTYLLMGAQSTPKEPFWLRVEDVKSVVDISELPEIPGLEDLELPNDLSSGLTTNSLSRIVNTKDPKYADYRAQLSENQLANLTLYAEKVRQSSSAFRRDLERLAADVSSLCSVNSSEQVHVEPNIPGNVQLMREIRSGAMFEGEGWEPFEDWEELDNY